MASPRSSVNLDLRSLLDLSGDRARAEAAETRRQEEFDYQKSLREQKGVDAAVTRGNEAVLRDRATEDRAQKMLVRNRENEAYLRTETKRKSDKETNDQAQIAYLVRRFGADHPRTLKFIRRVGTPEYGVTTARETPEGGVELYGNLSEDEPGTNLIYALNKDRVDWSVRLIEEPLAKTLQVPGRTSSVTPSGLRVSETDPLLKERGAKLAAETVAAKQRGKYWQRGGAKGTQGDKGLSEFVTLLKATPGREYEGAEGYNRMVTAFTIVRSREPNLTTDQYFTKALTMLRNQAGGGGGGPTASRVGQYVLRHREGLGAAAQGAAPPGVPTPAPVDPGAQQVGGPEYQAQQIVAVMGNYPTRAAKIEFWNTLDPATQMQVHPLLTPELQKILPDPKQPGVMLRAPGGTGRKRDNWTGGLGSWLERATGKRFAHGGKVPGSGMPLNRAR